jgi:peptidoglycan/xylan/chitin deacetylase (PgdA/CDA1 family)
MSGPTRVFLMYHELELPGRPLCQSEPGYVRYIVSGKDFRAQIDSLRHRGYRGLNVSQAFSDPAASGVVLTFDDGCETDLLTAAPILSDANFSATFFITLGFLDKRGYLSRAQLRELSQRGFNIGCHSMTHPYLNNLEEKALRWEIADAKNELEQIIGKAVNHFSCPGGRWAPRVPHVAKEAGYSTVCTSRVAANSPNTDPFFLGRVAIMRGTDLNTFQRICAGAGLWHMRMKDETRAAVRRCLGNSAYDRLRAVLLRPEARSKTPS